MKSYIGTKQIKAKPMTRLFYNLYRGWDLSADENGDDEGMLIEYVDGGAANHPDHSGYISWSPLAVFTNTYRQDDTFLERLLIEKEELSNKVTKLFTALEAGSIPEEAVAINQLQLSIMNSYLQVLDIKINQASELSV